jgi:selenoprotein W-related protein
LPKAAGLADAIRKAVGVDAQLIPGGGGIFDVAVDGRRIYSKHETGQFPTDQEIVSQLPK